MLGLGEASRQYYYTSTPLCIIAKIFEKSFYQVDKITRAIAFNTFIKFSGRLTINNLWRIIDEITGGLGYRTCEKDLFRVIQVGCLISWPEAVASGSRVLEIGTGLGRTMYCILASRSNVEYYSLDASPVILSIALYRNPFEVFREKLWRKNVFLILGDALHVVRVFNNLGLCFNHIVHDGGPNPQKNPRLYSQHFLKLLVNILCSGGTISVFAGKNPRIVSKIFNQLRNLGLMVWTESSSGIKIRVIRGEK